MFGKRKLKHLEHNLNKNIEGVMQVAKEAVKEILLTPEWQNKLEAWTKNAIREVSHVEHNKNSTRRPEDGPDSDKEHTDRKEQTPMD